MSQAEGNKAALKDAQNEQADLLLQGQLSNNIGQKIGSTSAKLKRKLDEELEADDGMNSIVSGIRATIEQKTAALNLAGDRLKNLKAENQMEIDRLKQEHHKLETEYADVHGKVEDIKRLIAMDTGLSEKYEGDLLARLKQETQILETQAKQFHDEAEKAEKELAELKQLTPQQLMKNLFKDEYTNYLKIELENKKTEDILKRFMENRDRMQPLEREIIQSYNECDDAEWLEQKDE